MIRQECSIIMTVASEANETVQLLADEVFLILKSLLNIL